MDDELDELDWQVHELDLHLLQVVVDDWHEHDEDLHLSHVVVEVDDDVHALQPQPAWCFFSSFRSRGISSVMKKARLFSHSV